MKSDKLKNSLRVTNISKALESERLRSNTPFVFIPYSESYYLHEGKEISENQFNILYPIERLQKTSYKGENSDRSKNWINDVKSY